MDIMTRRSPRLCRASFIVAFLLAHLLVQAALLAQERLLRPEPLPGRHDACRAQVLHVNPRVTVKPIKEPHPGFGPRSQYSCHLSRDQLASLNVNTVRLHPFQPFLSCEGHPDDSLMRQFLEQRRPRPAGGIPRSDESEDPIIRLLSSGNDLSSHGDASTKSVPANASDAGSLTLPTLGAWGSCAVVLSGQSLLHSGCGDRINRHDTVIRFNAPPVAGYEQDVGNRTDFMFINWKVEKNLTAAVTTAEFLRHAPGASEPSPCDGNSSTLQRFEGARAGCDAQAGSDVDANLLISARDGSSKYGTARDGSSKPETARDGSTRLTAAGTQGDPQDPNCASLFGSDPCPGIVILTDEYLGPANRDADCRLWRDTLGQPTLGMDHDRYPSARAMLREMAYVTGFDIPLYTLPALGLRGILTSLPFCRAVDVFGVARDDEDGHYFAPRDRMWSGHDVLAEAALLERWEREGGVDVEVYATGPPCEEPYVYGMYAPKITMPSEAAGVPGDKRRTAGNTRERLRSGSAVRGQPDSGDSGAEGGADATREPAPDGKISAARAELRERVEARKRLISARRQSLLTGLSRRGYGGGVPESAVDPPVSREELARTVALAAQRVGDGRWKVVNRAGHG